MTAQRLDRVLTAFRIGDPDGKHPVFDATGSTLYPGRWNTADCPVIYASIHYSTALLEKLAGGRGAMPPRQHFVEITIPTGVSYEIVEPAFVPEWDRADFHAPAAFGANWHRERRSAILLVPSVVARLDQNVLINPEHADFPRVTHGLHRPVWWDARLFGGA